MNYLTKLQGGRRRRLCSLRQFSHQNYAKGGTCTNYITVTSRFSYHIDTTILLSLCDTTITIVIVPPH